MDKEQELLFLCDATDTVEKAMARREKKKKEGLLELLKATQNEEKEEKDNG